MTRPIKGIAFFVSIIVSLLSCEDESRCRVDQLEITLLQQVNQLRSEGCRCGAVDMPPVPLLTWNEDLAEAAEQHVNDMLENNYFEHQSPDGSSPLIRAQRAGYTGEYVGEDIARGYNCVDDVVRGWQESETHCKAMMDTTYLEMGAATTSGLWVLDLGRPPE